MSAPVFALDRVGVDYRTPAGIVSGVDDITVDVGGRGITVLAGPSGSGKSTLLRVLGLFERPTRGRCVYRGTDTGVLGHRARRALRRDELSLVFQNPPENLLEYLDVGKNLMAAAQSAGTECEPGRILDGLGLADMAQWRISALSGGQQQRLAFGCALARRSSVIIADEPTSQLDETSADLVLDTLRQLADDGHTVIVSSHDDRLIRLGGHVVRLHNGRVEDGPSEDQAHSAGETR